MSTQLVDRKLKVKGTLILSPTVKGRVNCIYTPLSMLPSISLAANAVATPAANGKFLSLVCWVLPTLQTRHKWLLHQEGLMVLN